MYRAAKGEYRRKYGSGRSLEEDVTGGSANEEAEVVRKDGAMALAIGTEVKVEAKAP